MSPLRWQGLRIRGIGQSLGHNVVVTLLEYASGPPSRKLNASELTTSGRYMASSGPENVRESSRKWGRSRVWV